MRTARRHLRHVAASWLVLQLLVTVWAPVALYAATASESHGQDECTCEHPSGGVCPMHRHSSSSPSPSTACSLRSAMDPLDALVASLVGPIGVLPGFVTPIASIDVSLRLSSVEGVPLDRLVPPDPPPPRA